MFKVESLIEKELQLEQNVKDNKKSVEELLTAISELSKKKPENIRYALCGSA